MIFVTVHAKAYFVILATIHYMGSNKTMKYVNTLFHTTIVRPVPYAVSHTVLYVKQRLIGLGLINNKKRNSRFYSDIFL